MTGVYHGTCELHPLVQLARNATKGNRLGRELLVLETRSHRTPQRDKPSKLVEIL